MAHTSNISITARFLFRPYRGRWKWTRATILDWAEFSGLRNLEALVSLTSPYKVRLTSESVTVRIAVWGGRDEGEVAPGVSGILGALSVGFDEYKVELKRGDLPPGLLEPHENPESTPDISGRGFDLLACRLPGMTPFGSITPGDSIRDAWAMRAELFALKNDLDATCRFLNCWGLWNSSLVHQLSPNEEAFSGALISPHRLWSSRDAYIKAAAGSPRAWLSTATPLSFKESAKRPYFIVERSYCEDAIKATLTIDHLSNVKFGICKLPDCRELFKRKTAQKRLYCSPEHAHLANVRKLRAIKSKSKGRKNAEGQSA